MSTKKPTVFLSYSHRDRRWVDRLLTHLRAMGDNVSVWSDAEIKAGQSFEEVIAAAIATADVAIVLVSADYLASDFIVNHELPKLLESAAAGQTLLLPVMLSAALFEASPLAQFQFVNDPRHPISALKPADQDRVFSEVARVIQQRLPDLARHDKPGELHSHPATQLTPLVDEIAARVVQLLGYRSDQRPLDPGKPPRRSVAESNLVFVAMTYIDDMEPIYESISAAAASVGLEAKRVKDISGDYRIADKIMEMILSAQFVVVDLTHERPNVYFELGYARASGKTVITIARRDTKIHFNVKDWTYIPYIDSRTLERDLRERFANELQR